MNKNKIDFVMVWVDGNDEKWKKEKNQYKCCNGEDDRDIRFRDWENLKYWFRGIEKYCIWVNNVYFVTCGHLPSWLNINNPKIKIINHKDFIPEQYLPTFSSHTIELNLHRIKGLSENFVYFNDDIFIMKKLKEKNFFLNDKPRDISVFSPVSGKDEIYLSVCNKVNLIINKHFTKKEILKHNFFNIFNVKYGKLNIRSFLCLPFKRILGFYESHSCNSYNKKILEEVWQEEYEILNNTCLHKFRTENDVNQYIFKQWQFCTGNIIPIRNFKKSINIFNNIDVTCRMIEKGKSSILCLNDTISSNEEFENAKKRIINSFEKKFPEKSLFEL